MQYHYGYKSMEYLTSRPHLTVVKGQGGKPKSKQRKYQRRSDKQWRRRRDGGYHGDGDNEDEQFV